MSRDQRTADQRNHEDRDYQSNEDSFARSRWRLRLSDWSIPRIDSFEIDWSAMKRRGLNVDLLIGSQRIGAFPREPFVIGMQRHPGRRNFLKGSQIETGLTKE